jgi:hypothetical protein
MPRRCFARPAGVRRRPRPAAEHPVGPRCCAALGVLRKEAARARCARRRWPAAAVPPRRPTRRLRWGQAAPGTGLPQTGPRPRSVDDGRASRRRGGRRPTWAAGHDVVLVLPLLRARVLDAGFLCGHARSGPARQSQHSRTTQAPGRTLRSRGYCLGSRLVDLVRLRLHVVSCLSRGARLGGRAG